MSDTATTAPPVTPTVTSEKQLLLSVLYGMVIRSTNFTQEAERNLALGAIESLARASGADVQNISTSLRSKVRDFIVEKGLAVVPPDADPQPAAPGITGADVAAMIAAHDDDLIAKLKLALAPAPAPAPAAPVTTAPAESSVPG